MNTLFFILALISPMLIGFLLVSVCWPERKMTHPPFDKPFDRLRIPLRTPFFWYKLCLSIGIGLGLTSLTSFFILLLAGSTNIFLTFLLEAFLICLFVMILWHRRQPFFPPFIQNREEPTTLSRLLASAFYTSLVLAIGVFILRSLENPHGEPDAFYLWNSCARFLLRSGEQWRNMFTANTWSHPDYPLLLPASVLRLWSYAGKETLIGPIIIAFLFTFATIGLLVSALCLIRGQLQGYIGGIVLASTPYFIKHGASQYADVPLGFYILATLILIVLRNKLSESIPGSSILLGINLGFSAWTKNEGILFLLIVILVYLLIRGGFCKDKEFFRHESTSLFLGLLPLLSTIMYFKLAIAPPNDLLTGQNFQHTLEKLTDLSRYLMTGKAFIRQIIEPYSLLYSTPIAVFFVYALLVGMRWSQFKKPDVLISLSILLFIILGFFFIYITTPHNLSWHLETSLSRLFLQLWPSIIFVVCLCFNTPQERNQTIFYSC